MTALILDTDIDTDCDDCGALAVAHALLDAEALDLLAIVCSLPLPACPQCVQVINAAYGRGDLPVGLLALPDWEAGERYRAYRKHRDFCARRGMLYNELPFFCQQRPPDAPAALDAVALYRTLLSGAPDGSVTVCAIGTLSALEQLLASKPDGESDLDGRALVARKVERLVTMAKADLPRGRDPFNWAKDAPAAEAVLRDWPTPVVVSAAGDDVLTGERFLAAAPQDHPVAIAYRTWLEAYGKEKRPSWDQIALLLASGTRPDLFEDAVPGGLSFSAATGEHQWLETPAPGAPWRCRRRPSCSAAEMAMTIEDLMIASLGAAQQEDNR